MVAGSISTYLTTPMALNIEQDVERAIEELADDTADAEPWAQEDVLNFLLNDRKYNYDQLGAVFGVDPEEVGSEAVKHDVNPGREQPDYTSNVVPVANAQGDWGNDDQYYEDIRIPLPEHLVEELGVGQTTYEIGGEEVTGGALFRYMIDISQGDIDLIADTSPHREGRDRHFGNERRVSFNETTHHALMRLPRTLARILGLNLEADSDTVWGGRTSEDYQLGRDAELEVIGGDVRITFDPALESELIVLDKAEPPTPDLEAGEDWKIPSAKPKTLQPLHPQLEHNTKEDGIATAPKHTGQYRLSFPQSYTEAYGLEGTVDPDRRENMDGEEDERRDGTPVTIRFGVTERDVGPAHADIQPAIILEPGYEAGDDEPGTVHTIQESPAGWATSDGSRPDKTQTHLYIPKSLLHAIGYAGNDPDKRVAPSVRLTPDTDRIILTPAQETTLYSPLDKAKSVEADEETQETAETTA